MTGRVTQTEATLPAKMWSRQAWLQAITGVDGVGGHGGGLVPEVGIGQDRVSASSAAGAKLADNAGWKVIEIPRAPARANPQPGGSQGGADHLLCDRKFGQFSIQLGGLNLLAKIDYSIVPRDTVIDPAFTPEYGAALLVQFVLVCE